MTLLNKEDVNKPVAHRFQDWWRERESTRELQQNPSKKTLISKNSTLTKICLVNLLCLVFMWYLIEGLLVLRTISAAASSPFSLFLHASLQKSQTPHGVLHFHIQMHWARQWLITSIVTFETQKFSMHSKPVFDTNWVLLTEWLTRSFQTTIRQCKRRIYVFLKHSVPPSVSCKWGHTDEAGRKPNDAYQWSQPCPALPVPWLWPSLSLPHAICNKTIEKAICNTKLSFYELKRCLNSSLRKRHTTLNALDGMIHTRLWCTPVLPPVITTWCWLESAADDACGTVENLRL